MFIITKRRIALPLFFIFLVSSICVYFSSTWAIGWNVDRIKTIYADNKKAILFEDKKDGSFGIAFYEKYGPFYFKSDYTYSDQLSYEEPFSTAGFADEDDFLIAIKLPPSSNIKYFAVGNHLEEEIPLNETLTLEDIKKNSSEYTIIAVEEEYVFLNVHDYSEKTWTIRGFDSSGELIADKPFFSSPRFLE